MFSSRPFLQAVLYSVFLVFPSACNGEDPMSSPDKDQVDSPYTVGVYYYPWYSGDFHGGRYMRKELIPPQLPMLGEYDDRKPSVIAQHLKWSRQANISLWVASWWGPNSREDQTLLQHILPHDELGDMQIALFYETTGRTKEFSAFDNVTPDIAHIAERYFNHPNYLRIDGRPVLFVYLTRVLSRNGTLAEVVEAIRATAREAGHDIYLVGDEVFGQPPPSSEAIGLLDAVTNYDVVRKYGSEGLCRTGGSRSVLCSAGGLARTGSCSRGRVYTRYDAGI